MKTMYRRSFCSVLLLLALGTSVMAASDHLVDLLGIQQRAVGRTYVTDLRLRAVVAGGLLTRANNRAVASPSSEVVRRGQQFTVTVTSPQQHNTLIVTHPDSRQNQTISW